MTHSSERWTGHPFLRHRPRYRITKASRRSIRHRPAGRKPGQRRSCVDVLFWQLEGHVDHAQRHQGRLVRTAMSEKDDGNNKALADLVRRLTTFHLELACGDAALPGRCAAGFLFLSRRASPSAPPPRVCTRSALRHKPTHAAAKRPQVRPPATGVSGATLREAALEPFPRAREAALRTSFGRSSSWG